MKKIFLASVLSFAAGMGSVHAYWWLQSIRFDAERMRDLDEDFAEAAEIFYTSEAAEVEYDAPDEDE